MNFLLFRTPTETLSLEIPAPPAEPPSSPSKPPKSRNLGRVLIAATVGAVVVLVIWALIARHRARAQAATASSLQTAIVTRGRFTRILRLTGTTEAVEAYTIAGPQISGSGFGQLVVTWLPSAGAHVKKGDVLAEFDRQSQIQAFLEARASYQDLVDKVAKNQAAEIAARAKDDTDLKQAEDNLKQARLEVLKDPILSAIDVEKNKLSLEEAQAKLQQLRSTYALKRRSAQAGIRDLQIQAEAKLLAMQHAQQNENSLVIHSPVDGVVVLDPIWKGNGMGQVEVGDQVWNGEPFLDVVNTGVMEVRLEVNQDDVPYLHTSQLVTVRLDAYPRVSFPGRIEKISPVGIAGTLSDRIRTFAAVASIQGNDPRLTPDLSAAVDVELDSVPHTLMVPREAIVRRAGQNYVFLRDGSTFRREAIRVGPMNDTEAVIDSGLRAGDIVERNPKAVTSDK